MALGDFTAKCHSLFASLLLIVPMLDFSQFEWLSFDCYGTLIDWETGLLDALRPILKAHGAHRTDAELLKMYGVLEARAEAGAYKKYREILREVVRGFGRELSFHPTEIELDSLPESLRRWEPFPDTADALRGLKNRYKLAVISNIDDDLFVYTAPKLGVELDALITAEQAGAYKPSHKNFTLAQARMGIAKEKWLHVAQSRHHDIAPALQLGIHNVLVNRRGAGATVVSGVTPDLEVPDLKTLADKAGV
jgi:2-haloacid dehalogenase